MKLICRDAIGLGMHRNGWPSAVQAMRDRSDDNGVLIDDFADASFSYAAISQPYEHDWIGIFHHPVKILSPFPADHKHRLRWIANHPHWDGSRRHLRKCVALCQDVATDLHRWLDLPVLSLLHPVEKSSTRWRAERALAARKLVQVGFTLRNTRAIYQIRPRGWSRIHLFGAGRWHQKRNDYLRNRRILPEIRPESVEVKERIDNAAYDALLEESVIITEMYGAAANNVVVECMVRGTPLLLNRWPATEEYLGRDYPLFFADVRDARKLLDPARIRDASAQLLERATLLPNYQEFAAEVARFAETVDG